MSNLTQDVISRLSPPERLALIGELWDSIADADLPVPPAQVQELQRRMASFEQDKAQAHDWEQVKTELAARAP